MDQSENKVHVFEMTIPLYEVDMGGGVYHGNYFHLFELARDIMLKEAGFSYSNLVDLGFHLTVTEINCTYRTPLLYNEKIKILTRVDKISSRSAIFFQQIWNDRQDKLLTELSMSLVCIKLSGKASRIPEPFKKALLFWMDDMQLDNTSSSN